MSGLRVVFCGIGAIAALIIVVGVSSGPPTPEQAAKQREDDFSDRSLQYDARRYVSQRLRDPSSATFQNETTSERIGDAKLVCGEVNAKNGFGGFTGFSNYTEEFFMTASGITHTMPIFDSDMTALHLTGIDLCSQTRAHLYDKYRGPQPSAAPPANLVGPSGAGAPSTLLTLVTGANIRSGPSANNSIIRVGKKGDILTLFETRGAWLRVGNLQSEGWVAANLAKPASTQ